MRDKRELRNQVAELTAKFKSEGKTVVEDYGYCIDEEDIAVTSLKRADGEPATDEDANAVHISSNYRGAIRTTLVVTGWKELGFTPKHERSSEATGAQKGPMTDEQKAERKTLIANNKVMESVLLTELQGDRSEALRRGGHRGRNAAEAA